MTTVAEGAAPVLAGPVLAAPVLAGPGPERPATRPPLTPALYEGRVIHRRHAPVPHAFEQPSLLVLLDADHVDGAFAGIPGWSTRWPAPVRFRRRDYLDGTDRPLGDTLRDLVEDRLGRRPQGAVQVLTQPRIAGWLFNPLTTYLCLAPGADSPDIDSPGADVGATPALEAPALEAPTLEAIVLEVTNTPWKQRHWYVVDVDPDRPHGPWDLPKAMHVSPFLPMDLTYRLRFTPGEHLRLHLAARSGDRTVFDAHLDARRQPLDAAHAARALVRNPASTLRVSAGIHAHALRLWRKGVPFQPHPGRARETAAAPPAGPASVHPPTPLERPNPPVAHRPASVPDRHQGDAA